MQSRGNCKVHSWRNYQLLMSRNRFTRNNSELKNCVRNTRNSQIRFIRKFENCKMFKVEFSNGIILRSQHTIERWPSATSGTICDYCSCEIKSIPFPAPQCFLPQERVFLIYGGFYHIPCVKKWMSEKNWSNISYSLSLIDYLESLFKASKERKKNE